MSCKICILPSQEKNLLKQDKNLHMTITKLLLILLHKRGYLLCTDYKLSKKQLEQLLKQ